MELVLYNQRLLDCCFILSILDFSLGFRPFSPNRAYFAPKLSSLSDACYRDWHTFGVPGIWLVNLSMKKTPEKQGFFVSAEGFEPSANGLKGHCSAVELRAHQKRTAF